MRPRRTALTSLLSPPRALPPPRPQSAAVGARQNLPGQIRYGFLQPGQPQNSAFTAARAPSPMASLVHPAAMPEQFNPPAYPSARPNAVAPMLAALGLLTGAPHGGEPTPTMATGATIEQFQPPPPQQPTLTTGLKKPPGYGDTVLTEDPTYGGAPGAPVYYEGRLPSLTTGIAPGVKENYGTTTPLAALLASLAQFGQKINPSRRARLE